MRISKRFLVATSALTLSMSAAAFADSNKAYLDQIQSGGGTGTNSALIDQSGGEGNEAGSDSQNIRQKATSNKNNTLNIVQSGNYNDIGLGGFEQKAESGPNSSLGNTATITQSSSYNVVGKVTQFNRFGGSAGENSLTILQEMGDGNEITEVFQDKHKGASGNTADILMSGVDNTIALVQQAATGGIAGNFMDVDITGDNNGNAPLSGFAALSGANTSELKQGFADNNDGNWPKGNNSLTLNIAGHNNQFGVTQEGTNNTVGTLSITGSDNELGISQAGNANIVDLAVLGGNFNNIGIAQLGTNFADVSISGSSNEAGILQVGWNGNGSDGFGVKLTIDGDYNGTGYFSGAAQSVGGAFNGVIGQGGSDNLFDATITGNSNMFAGGQLGDDNTIQATVTGDTNQFAVLQMGDSNMASLVQTGNGNNAGISQ
ncbi:hypothetical protein [Pseudophaeobacter sp. C1-32P7]|uniref:hypothetical protein n=1 Tax=Pseudophaeobacter sp. C1-32P7 TaxID=3098142 RepID=UPI0034D493CD